MPLRRIYKFGILAVFAVTFVIVALTSCPDRQKSLPMLKEKKASLEIVVIKNFAFNEYSREKRIISLKAESLKIAPMRLSFFKLGWAMVARLEKVKVCLYDFEEELKEGGIDHFAKKISEIKIPGGKLLKGLEINKLEVQVYSKEGDLISSIFSRRAKMDFLKKRLVFEGKVNVFSGKKKLFCQKMEWREKRKKFGIKGGYTLQSGGRPVKGKGGEIDIRLTHETK